MCHLQLFYIIFITVVPSLIIQSGMGLDRNKTKAEVASFLCAVDIVIVVSAVLSVLAACWFYMHIGKYRTPSTQCDETVAGSGDEAPVEPLVPGIPSGPVSSAGGGGPTFSIPAHNSYAACSSCGGSGDICNIQSRPMETSSRSTRTIEADVGSRLEYVEWPTYTAATAAWRGIQLHNCQGMLHLPHLFWLLAMIHAVYLFLLHALPLFGPLVILSHSQSGLDLSVVAVGLLSSIPSIMVGTTAHHQ